MSDDLGSNVLLALVGAALGIGGTFFVQWLEGRRQDRRERVAQVEELYLLVVKWGLLACEINRDRGMNLMGLGLEEYAAKNNSRRDEVERIIERVTVLVGVHLPELAEHVDRLNTSLFEAEVVWRTSPHEEDPHGEVGRHLRVKSVEIVEKTEALKRATVALLRRPGGWRRLIPSGLAQRGRVAGGA